MARLRDGRSWARRGRSRSLAPALVVVAAAAVVVAACAPRRAAVAEAQTAYRVEGRSSVELGAFKGISGLTGDADGLWAVPERDRALLPVALDGPHPGLRAAAVPLAGVPAEMDTESIAALGGGRFALGTETPRPGRASDDILFVTVDGGAARVVDRVALSYAPWGLAAEPNRGIEGLCFAAGRLLAASESRGTLAGGGRFAPLARWDETSRAFTAFRLRLTSSTGKVSALACRPTADGRSLEVLAVERHFGVARLLGFSVPRDGPGGELAPAVLLDLVAAVPRIPNFEGVAFAGGDRVALISDNDYGGVTGPTEALLLAPR
jgi:hypothetical protein